MKYIFSVIGITIRTERWKRKDRQTDRDTQREREKTLENTLEFTGAASFKSEEFHVLAARKAVALSDLNRPMFRRERLQGD